MRLHQIDPKTGRWLGSSKTVQDTSGILRGWVIAEADPLPGQRWGGTRGWIGEPVVTETASAKLRSKISARYDELVAAGLGVGVPSIADPVVVLPQDVALLGGAGAATASRLSMWQAMGQTEAFAGDAATTALTDYKFGQATHTLTNGQFAALYLGYFSARDALYQAHDRAKKACDAGQAPDPADMAILWPEGM